VTVNGPETNGTPGDKPPAADADSKAEMTSDECIEQPSDNDNAVQTSLDYVLQESASPEPGNVQLCALRHVDQSGTKNWSCLLLLLLLLLLLKSLRVYLSAVQLEKKLLEHFTEVTISNGNVTRGNLCIRKFLGVA